MFNFKKNSTNKTLARQRVSRNNLLENRRYLYHSVSLEHAKQQKNIEQINSSINISEVKFASFWTKRLLKLIILSIIIVGMVRFLTLSENAKVEVVNNKSLNYAYQSLVDKQLASSWLNDNKLTISVNGIDQVLENNYPTIVNIKTNIPLIGSQLVLYVTTSAPKLFLSTTYNAGLVDGQGRVVSVNKVDQSSSGLVVVNYPIPIKLSLGDNILPASDVNFISDVSYELSLKKITVSYYEVLPGANELDAYIANTKYYVKFNLQIGQPLVQIGSYLAVIHNLNTNNIVPRQYIDVRIPGRVYYR